MTSYLDKTKRINWANHGFYRIAAALSFKTNFIKMYSEAGLTQNRSAKGLPTWLTVSWSSYYVLRHKFHKYKDKTVQYKSSKGCSARCSFEMNEQKINNPLLPLAHYWLNPMSKQP